MKAKNISPFKFLDSYSIEDKDIFFGRDVESKELYKKFFSKNLLLLYGKSGTGKSSLINCGLMARIPKEDALLIPIRCGNDPYENTIEALQALTTKKSRDEITLIENIYEEHFKPLAFVFDQFEEIFIIADKNKRNRFIKALKKILSYNRVKKNIILIVREEYLANLTDIESEIPTLFDNRMRLRGIDINKYNELIERPCRRVGIAIEPGLSQQIIKKIHESKESFELTYFQIMMDNLYRKAIGRDSKSPIISKKDFESIGNIENILGDFLNYELTRVSDLKRTEMVLKALVSNKGTKNPLTLKEISKATSITEIISNRVIRELVSKRVLREKNEKGQYELMHDSLAKRIYNRMSEEEKKAVEIKQLISVRYGEFVKSKTLIDKDTLELIQPYLKHLILDKKTIVFIKKSQEKAFDKINARVFYLIALIFVPVIIIISILVNNNSKKNGNISSLKRTVKELKKIQTNVFIDNMQKDYAFVEEGQLYFLAQPGVANNDSTKYISVNSFYMCTHEVTVAEYRLYCKQNNKKLPEKPKWGWNDNSPIVNVNWNDANNFCSWLSKKTGKSYRLPTEAEYEFAAKGGNSSKKHVYSGASYSDVVAVYKTSSPNMVKSRQPNELGIYDLSGNVREWCSDWYSEDIVIYDRDNYLGPDYAFDDRNLKVVRGGAFSSDKSTIKVTSRYYGRVDAVNDENGGGLEHFGFRCVRNL